MSWLMASAAELFGFGRQMGVDAGGGWRAMAQPLLNQAQIDASFEQMRGPGMAQRMHGGAFVVATLFQGRAESVLHTALGHRLGGPVPGRCGHGLRRERASTGLRWVLPVLAQQLQRALRQRDIAIFGALAVADVNHHAGAVDVGDLQMGSFLQAQAAGIDRRRDKLVARQSDGSENLAHFRQAEDDGQFLLRAPGARCRRWSSLVCRVCSKKNLMPQMAMVMVLRE